MRLKTAVVVSLSACLGVMPAVASAQPLAHGGPDFEPGAPGVGDPYFPLDGNGGYDVEHYRLELGYDPDTDVLTGKATITAEAAQDLSRFNLDFEGLTVRSITVNAHTATWTRDGGELTVTPRRGLRDGRRFTTVVRYDGVPATLPDGSGFLHTDDGALVIGQPDVAATWFPVNDHPIDKASYAFRITAPADLEVVANGTLDRRSTRHGLTTWSWNAREPMASYLAMMAIGEFDLRAYHLGRVKGWDAIDPALFEPVAAPHTGAQFALSDIGDSSYKRLARTLTVPAGGAELSFWIARDTETEWDFVFVEAHRVGTDEWTTLPDLNANTSQDTGFSCPTGWHALHPFLARYQTVNTDATCSPSTPTGEWWAATGSSDGAEQWAVDLSAYANSDVEVAIAYASDEVVQGQGVFVDDIVVTNGPGSTSFEDDGDVFDGWTVPGAPEGSPDNPNDWFVGTAADVPPAPGVIAEGSFARHGEILDFLASTFGRYPFSAVGGIVDHSDELGFALENQTRPIYAEGFFTDSVSGDSVVVHELAHQWYGDYLALEAWPHIWLNEGFATYAEWLWSEHDGLGTTQEVFDFFYEAFPADHPFWDVIVGDPGPDELFSFANYARGAMTLHQLRLAIGDDDFFRLLGQWTRSQAGGNVNTDEFIALAERISHQELDDLFATWLFTPGKPDLPVAAAAASAGGAAAASAGAAPVDLRHAPAVARNLVERLGQEALLGA